MENQLVVFDLANEHYGVEIAAVEGIIKMQPITVVPRAPGFVEGVTNLRGKILPVIDLRRRFGLPPLVPPASGGSERGYTKDTRIVVVEIPASASGTGVNGATVGIVVDGVSEVLRVSPEAIEPPSPIVTGVDTGFIKGIAKVETQHAASLQGAPAQADRLVILLDLGKVLSAQEHTDLKALPVAA